MLQFECFSMCVCLSWLCKLVFLRVWFHVFLFANTTRNLIHSNPCICNFYPNQPFLWLYFVALGKNDYKMVCNCICNLYLQLVSIWMKMKMKIHLCHPFLMASQNRWKFNCFCNLEGGSRAIGHHMASFQFDFWL
jgi:hypothetical protein